MAELIETLIGVLITASICYAKHYYGTRAAIELIVIFVVLFALAVFFITEIMKSVSQEALDDETYDEEFTRKRNSSNVFRKLIAYHVLEKSTNAFDKIVGWCSETLEVDEEGDSLYE